VRGGVSFVLCWTWIVAGWVLRVQSWHYAACIVDVCAGVVDGSCGTGLGSVCRLGVSCDVVRAVGFVLGVGCM
jgi:hypothetical protein